MADDRNEITPASIVVATTEQLSSQLGDETVILHLSEGVYFGLDAVGAKVWSLLKEPRSVQEIRDAVMEEYDVDALRCEQSLVRLLRELADAKLIEVSNPPLI